MTIIETITVSFDYRQLKASARAEELTNLETQTEGCHLVQAKAAYKSGDLILTYYRTTWVDQPYPLAAPPVLKALAVRYRDGADPALLMPDDHFTVAQLRRLHELINGRALDKDTFRRRVVPYLTATGRTYRGSVHNVTGRPAELFSLSVDEGLEA